MTLLERSRRAPDFAVRNQDGITMTLASLRGHRVVLWWYPKADTPS